MHPTLRNQQAYPDLVRRHLPETTEYFSYLHLNVVHKLSSLFDIILELPEGTIWSLFDVTEDRPEISGGGFGRAMLYHGMSADDEKKTKGDWLRGHSDASSLTFITPQPMASLQFRDYHDGEWKFVGYRPNALVVNLGDRFEVRPALVSSFVPRSASADTLLLLPAVPYRLVRQVDHPPSRRSSR